jgi:hypothetical protein
MESEFGVLGVARKPMKYVVDLSKRKRIHKKYVSFCKVPKQQTTNFWSQGILEINEVDLFLVLFYILYKIKIIHQIIIFYKKYYIIGILVHSLVKTSNYTQPFRVVIHFSFNILLHVPSC